jgi:hypothetical protein
MMNGRQPIRGNLGAATVGLRMFRNKPIVER